MSTVTYNVCNICGAKRHALHKAKPQRITDYVCLDYEIVHLCPECMRVAILDMAGELAKAQHKGTAEYINTYITARRDMKAGEGNENNG